MIIGISGKIGSGKDTVGKTILDLDDIAYPAISRVTRHNWQIKKFAGKLKDITCLLIGCTREQLEDDNFKNQELGEEWWYWKVPCFGYKWEELYLTEEKAKNASQFSILHKDPVLVKLTPRLLLQFLGTECGRNIIHPNIWCTSLFTDYHGDIEMWKDIVGYEGKYQISSFGRVKGLDREIIYGDKSKGQYHTKKESILKPTLTGKYEMIRLEGNNSVTVHSLVANAFLPKIEGKNYVNHIDQNPLNNFYKNLEWCTQSENIIDANSKGNGNIGEKQSDAKLTDKDVEQIRILLKDRSYKQVDIAQRFKVCPTTISDIKHGRKWSHVGKNSYTLNPIVPQQPPNWIITDVRFPNEADAIKQRNGILIRVNRDLVIGEDDFGYTRVSINQAEKDGIIDPQHESETALDDYKFDYIIDNNGTIEELTEKVKVILKEII